MPFNCERCGQVCKSKSGLTNHMNKCNAAIKELPDTEGGGGGVVIKKDKKEPAPRAKKVVSLSAIDSVNPNLTALYSLYAKCCRI
jgi:hypothetical protein